MNAIFTKAGGIAFLLLDNERRHERHAMEHARQIIDGLRPAIDDVQLLVIVPRRPRYPWFPSVLAGQAEEIVDIVALVHPWGITYAKSGYEPESYQYSDDDNQHDRLIMAGTALLRLAALYSMPYFIDKAPDLIHKCLWGPIDEVREEYDKALEVAVKAIINPKKSAWKARDWDINPN